MKIDFRAAWILSVSLLSAQAFSLTDNAPSTSSTPLPQRHVALDGIQNLRDLGGYQTEDGRKVRWHVLYRSSDLTDMSVADRDKLDGLGLATICDLRSERERETRPDPQLSHGQFDDRCHSANSNTEMLAPKPGIPVDWRAQFIGFYRQAGRLYAPQYRALFDDLKQQKTPLLLHCTAGKDRTGVGSALILLALGVPKDVVIADYHLTEQYLRDPRKAIAQNSPMPAGFAALLEAHPDYLNAALDGITEQYGSLDNYFESVLGVSKQDREQLRAQLLEN